MSRPTIASYTGAAAQSFSDGMEPVPLSLDSIQAPAAFVDRSARILHANAAFYNLVHSADLGDANWLAAFEQGESLGAHISVIEDTYDLTASCFNYADLRLMLWVAVSANAYPMAGCVDTFRLVSLHCGSDAVRLGLALRDETDQERGAHAEEHALQRHYAALVHPDARAASADRPPNPARQLLESLADHAPHECAGATAGASINGRLAPIG